MIDSHAAVPHNAFAVAAPQSASNAHVAVLLSVDRSTNFTDLLWSSLHVPSRSQDTGQKLFQQNIALFARLKVG